mmetsp:Transcript_70015/g.160889  ORF Transcript_70015/g.160889 Transcript_70015/m.160889 type:complete len:214 (+) Transcript_70015:179-820(+)
MRPCLTRAPQHGHRRQPCGLRQGVQASELRTQRNTAGHRRFRSRQAAGPSPCQELWPGKLAPAHLVGSRRCPPSSTNRRRPKLFDARCPAAVGPTALAKSRNKGREPFRPALQPPAAGGGDANVPPELQQPRPRRSPRTPLPGHWYQKPHRRQAPHRHPTVTRHQALQRHLTVNPQQALQRHPAVIRHRAPHRHPATHARVAEEGVCQPQPMM